MAKKVDENDMQGRSSIPLLTHQPDDPGPEGPNPEDYENVDEDKAYEDYMKTPLYILIDLENEEMIASSDKESDLLPFATKYLEENEEYITQVAIYTLKSAMSYD